MADYEMDHEKKGVSHGYYRCIFGLEGSESRSRAQMVLLPYSSMRSIMAQMPLCKWLKARVSGASSALAQVEKYRSSDC